MSKEESQSGRRVYRVLFVCTGNTCRSATAEGVLRKLIAELPQPRPDIVVESAGTLGIVGAPASPLAVEVATDFGVDLSAHQSQAVTPQLLDRSDLVLAMAGEHYQDCLALGVPEDKVFMLRHYPKHRPDKQSGSIPDPIGGDRKMYEFVYFQIDEALRRGLGHLIVEARQLNETDDS